MKKKQKMSRPQDVCSHPVTERYIQWILNRKLRRYASDGELYTFDEFLRYYCDNAGKVWGLASHFNSLQDFCSCFNLRLVRGYCGDEWWASSPAMFGVVFPYCLLLVDVHHLNGKLKGSTLDTSRNMWDNAWQIGPAGNEMDLMMALDFYTDFCTELHDSDHIVQLLGKLGRVEMESELYEFCAILDGCYSNYEMSDGDVECMTGWLHVPCCGFMCHARPFFACHAICLRVMPCHEYSVSCHVRVYSAKMALNKISNI